MTADRGAAAPHRAVAMTGFRERQRVDRLRVLKAGRAEPHPRRIDSRRPPLEDSVAWRHTQLPTPRPAVLDSVVRRVGSA